MLRTIFFGIVFLIGLAGLSGAAYLFGTVPGMAGYAIAQANAWTILGAGALSGAIMLLSLHIMVPKRQYY